MKWQPGFSYFTRGAACFASLLLLHACSQEQQETPTAKLTSTPPASSSTPGDTLPTLSSTIPLEITANPPFNLESLQHDFDVFSWQSFVALNWPANPDGTPNNNLVIGQQPGGPVVWQSWKESRDIFLPDGAQPPAWNQPNPVPEVCKDIGKIPDGTIHLTQVGKTPNVRWMKVASRFKPGH